MKVSVPPQVAAPQSPVVAQPVVPAEEAVECEVVVGELAAEPECMGRWQRFLDFNDRSAKKHPYATGVVTSFVITFGGDLVAKAIKVGGSPVRLDWQQVSHLLVIAGLCIYYGLESPEIFRRIDVAFPPEHSLEVEREDHAAPLVEGAKMMTGRRGILGGMRRLMSSFGRKIGALKRLIAGSAQGIRRAMAYRFAIAPWWTMRHMAFLGLLHGSTATPWRIAWDSLLMWAIWFVPLSVEEYLVQNKIPLEQRFLATSIGGFTWQVSASLMVLLGR